MERSGPVSEHRLISFDETPLFYRRVEAGEKPRALVVIGHGLGEHGGRYLALAHALSKANFETVIPDLRGFGKSGGPTAFAPSYECYLRDLQGIVVFLKRTQPRLPLFLLGHSFGGLLAVLFCQEFGQRLRVRGLVLSSPLFGLAIRVPLWRHLLGLAASFLVPTYTQPSQVHPQDLTHDAARIAEDIRDPDIHHRISGRLYGQMRRMMADAGKAAGNIKMPVLVLQAGDDRVVSRDSALHFYEALAAPDKECEVYEGWFHEILNEVGQEKVFARIAEWLRSRSDIE